MIKNLSRRRFLQLTGISTTGLVLGASGLAYWRHRKNSFIPLPAELPESAQTFNLFVHIETDDTVHIVVHRSEMGQGIRTGFAQVVAEELQADWQHIVVVQADGASSYGSQSTDSSRSMRDNYQRLREMGASARHMLEHAAAKYWGISPDLCQAQNHQVVRQDNLATLRFGELALTAATLSPPSLPELTFKNKDQFKYIGKKIPSVDLNDIVLGQAKYSADLQFPNTLYACIQRSPVLGDEVDHAGSAESIADVNGLSGVRKVHPIGIPTSKSQFKPLAGIAVVADSTWQALKAKRALNIQWKNKEEHSKFNSDDYIQELKNNLNKSGKILRQKGDTQAALNRSNNKHSAAYTLPYLAQAPMEPMAVVVLYDKKNINVWAGVQDPQNTKWQLHLHLGHDYDDIHVHVPLLGGSFGRKASPDFVLEAAEIAMHFPGNTLQLQWSREDDIQHSYYHSASAVQLEAGFNDNREINAWHAKSCFPSIAATFSGKEEYPASWEMELGLVNTPFVIEHETVECFSAVAHTRSGLMRSVSNIQHAFAVGSFVDELAIASGRDNVAMWLAMIGRDRYIDYSDHGYELGNYSESLTDFPFDNRRLKHVLHWVAEHSSYKATASSGSGCGLSCHYSFLTYVGIAVKVRLEQNQLKVDEVHCAIDCGTVVNPDRVIAQSEGAIVMALSAVLMGNISFKDGQVEQSNFHDYPVLRMHQTPKIRVHIVNSDTKPTGAGEPVMPVVAASLTNAIVAAGGERIRDLPVNKIYRV